MQCPQQRSSHNRHSPPPVLRHVHSLLQIEFSTERDLVLPLSASCIVSFPEGHVVAAYVILVFPSLLPMFQ